MATIIYDNSDTTAGTSTHYTDFSVNPCTIMASFKVPAGAAQKLDLLKMELEFAGFSGTATFNVDLYNDVAGTPGALNTNLVTNFTAPLVSNVRTLVNISPLTGTATISGNTRYWVAITDPLFSGVGWVLRDDTLGTGISTEFQFGTGTDTALCNFGPTPNGSGNGALMMVVGGDPAAVVVRINGIATW